MTLKEKSVHDLSPGILEEIFSLVSIYITWYSSVNERKTSFQPDIWESHPATKKIIGFDTLSCFGIKSMQ